ncbi:glycosyltransferase [Bacillus paranthracis]|uniref:glycosyltransferase n=1 Tax=Bacillus paranthracis TaxID=2026186 RepID=UPI003DA8433E
MCTHSPLVSILIPVTEKSGYLKTALISALFQTYDNVEIIVRDNTSTNEIQTMMEKEFLPYYNKIIYIKNDNQMTTLQLLQSLIEDSKGQYINFLLEKDSFYPTKVEKMMDYFLSDSLNTIQLVTSSQLQIDKNEQLIKSSSMNKYFLNDIKLIGVECGSAILQRQNCVGGLSAPLLKKEGLSEPFGYLKGQPFPLEYTIATWLSVLTKGSVIYISDELVFEREFQEQAIVEVDIARENEWEKLLLCAKQLGYLK